VKRVLLVQWERWVRKVKLVPWVLQVRKEFKAKQV
jgi:hypothetical protein